MAAQSDTKIIEQDILELKNAFIVHQCNCRSKNAAGLAAAIFKKYPAADVYAQNAAHGTISLVGQVDIVPCGDVIVVNLFGQVWPGQAPSRNFYGDTAGGRELFFKLALQDFEEKLRKIDRPRDRLKIAFPYNCGCGLAGGKWEKYYKMINTFSASVADIAEVVICKIPQTISN